MNKFIKNKSRHLFFGGSIRYAMFHALRQTVTGLISSISWLTIMLHKLSVLTEEY